MSSKDAKKVYAHCTAGVLRAKESVMTQVTTLREISVRLMERISFNYRTIVGFNTSLIGLGVAGVMPPATSAMLHNGSTVALGLKSMTNLLPEE